MNLPPSRPDAATPLVLPAHCSTTAAAALAEPLAAHLAGSADATVDASQVETLGQACVQLLLAACVERPGLRFSPASDAFFQQVERLGIAGNFGLDRDGGISR